MGSILRERYVVEGLLGKGGFGAVYLVKDMRVQGNLYALKEAINPQKRDRERFMFEGEILKHLDHRSLPRVYRVFEDEVHHRAYMLMDYIEGPNLEVERRLQLAKRFSLSQILGILAPIFDAVNYLHHQSPPILHRDIKPSNIIVPATGDDTVLVDFGIAKEFNPDATTTAFRTGSPGYAPPELYSTGTSIRSDIYELGATFYTLLTGTVPVDALHRMTLIGIGQPDPLVSIEDYNLDVPQDVANAVHRALSINSSDRFSTVEEFWRAIGMQPGWRPLDSEVVALVGPSTQPLATKKNTDTPLPASAMRIVKKAQKSRRWKFGVVLLLLLLVFIIVGTASGFYMYLMKSSPAHMAPAQANATVPLAAPSPTFLPTQIPTRAVPTPHPRSTPTSVPVVVPTAQPTLQPTPRPTIVSTPRPVHTPTPTPVPYPNVAGNYSGSINDTTANIITGMALAIQQQAGHGVINGYFTVNPPLQGSGKFTGSVNTNNYIQFVVQAYKKNGPLYFWGWLKSSSILSGDYCSLNAQNQCDPNAGASGTWSVAPAT
jgi:serine/threonine protein kinase